jgi:hypothetical protein
MVAYCPCVCTKSRGESREIPAKPSNARVERLYRIAYGIHGLSNDFFFNYLHLVDQFTKGITMDDSLRPTLQGIIIQADPLRLGLPFISKEFTNFFDEYVCHIYNGAARTLRTVLEATISIGDFCLDEERLKVKDIRDDLVKGAFPQEAYLLSFPAPALAERFRYGERHRRFVPFDSMLRMVDITVNLVNKKSVKELWEELSKYAHFSGRTYVEAIQESRQVTDSLAQDLYDYALDVVDVAFYVLIQSESHYSGISAEALISEIGHWVSNAPNVMSNIPIATNLMIEIPIIREEEFKERQRKFFPNSYRLLEPFDKELRPNRLAID